MPACLHVKSACQNAWTGNDTKPGPDGDEQEKSDNTAIMRIMTIIKIMQINIMAECTRQMDCCRRLPPLEVMTLIEQELVDLILVQGLKKSQVVEVISKGRTTTWIKKLTLGNVLGIISELNPSRSGLLMVQRQYDTFFVLPY